MLKQDLIVIHKIKVEFQINLVCLQVMNFKNTKETTIQQKLQNNLINKKMPYQQQTGNQCSKKNMQHL